MRILWFCGNPGRYKLDKGESELVVGSWIASLQEQMSAFYPDCQIALAFPYKGKEVKDELNGFTYYTIGSSSFKNKFIKRKIEEDYLVRASFIINDFRPDVIQVFGSETKLGLIYRITELPIVLHIQGILLPYKDAWYPPSYNSISELIQTLVSPSKLLNLLISRHYLKIALSWEKEICSHVKFFMGRTHWDKSVTSYMAKNYQYYYCSEMLRPIFYENSGKWNYKSHKTYKLSTIISGAVYKGGDVILKTAYWLKHQGVSFVWNIFGVSDLKWAEKLVGFTCNEVNVQLKGRTNCDVLCEELLDSCCYVHLAYIENSPNSVCEAQMLGVPVIAANVGGVSSLIKNGEDGILVPSNDAFMTATSIIEICTNPQLATGISIKGTHSATVRHAPGTITKDLMSVYQAIVQ